MMKSALHWESPRWHLHTLHDVQHHLPKVMCLLTIAHAVCSCSMWRA